MALKLNGHKDKFLVGIPVSMFLGALWLYTGINASIAVAEEKQAYIEKTLDALVVKVEKMDEKIDRTLGDRFTGAEAAELKVEIMKNWKWHEDRIKSLELDNVRLWAEVEEDP